ncbi:unnamed protein product [Leuciscus chuanchicus]
MQKLAYRTAEIDWEPKYPNFENLGQVVIIMRGEKKNSENKVTEFLGSDCAGSPEVKHWPCVRAIALVALGRASAQLHMMLVLPAPVWGLVRWGPVFELVGQDLRTIPGSSSCVAGQLLVPSPALSQPF